MTERLAFEAESPADAAAIVEGFRPRLDSSNAGLCEWSDCVSDWLDARRPSRRTFAEALLEAAPHPAIPGARAVAIDMRHAWSLFEGAPASLLPASMRSAATKRRIHFLAGRLCAQQAMRVLGVIEPIGRHASGMPAWPAKLQGSITHNDRLACAMVSAVDACGFGIDSEIIVSEDGATAVWQLCCTDDECLRWTNGIGRQLLATLIFSAKESLYKALYPRVNRYVDHLEVEVVDIDFESREMCFSPVTNSLVGHGVAEAECRFSLQGGMVHTVVQLSAA